MWQHVKNVSALELDRDPHHYLTTLLVTFNPQFKELVEAQSEDVRQILDALFENPVSQIVNSENESSQFFENMSAERAKELSVALRKLVCEVF